MTQKVPQRIVLSLVCALGLILIPLSPICAQSTVPSTSQQGTVDHDQNTDQNQSNPSATQNQDQYQNQNRTGKTRSQTTTESRSTTESQTANQNASNRNLPNTAGELPLIALIGLLSLGAAVGTRVLARIRSNR